ncbi:putative outer membrane starch-binding protein [Chitinophaga skermanii]|uniref:Putative outer membrane starch-binding protein n=1 Tax=Chitinophaga skermanii TaxID=331697 RepID=A0A327QCJ5_9BACT|nr:RagB/SusD family nutrient uptake outer membrane protein [Chitinophaga skermanii]RAJ02279.1 putative outer membrane starch-binding protein [Chitinophaga skermanii]
MKKLSIFLLSAMAAFSSCSDFLDREPLSQISPDNFFRTENDLKLYINSLNTTFPSAEDVYNEDIDNVVKTTLPEIVTGKRVIPVTGGGWSWTELRKVNYFMQNYNRLLQPAVTNKYMGIARFYRAYFYQNKVMRFGDVPWYNTALSVDDTELLNKARTPRTVVVDSIINDLDSAIMYCSVNKNVEEVTKWTALALKSRFCLFEGTFRKYHPEFNLPNANRFLQLAADASAELMKSGYAIYKSTPEKSYLELFAAAKANPTEIILARRFSNDLQIYHNVNYYTITASYGKPGLEKKLVNSYLMKDGTRFTDRPGYDTMTFYNECQNRDPRLAQTIRTPGYTRIGNTVKLVPDFGATTTGYQVVKFVSEEANDSYNKSFNDMPIFRYAEVLLNYAEAKAELGTLTQADLDASIKLLRDRVEMPSLNLAAANATPDPYLGAEYKNVTGTNKGVILEIRRERRIELVMESHRYNDIMRWKEGHLLAQQFKGMYFPGVGKYDLDNNGTVDVQIYEGTKPTEKGIQYLKLGSEVVLENNKGLILVNKNIDKTFNELRDYLYPIPTQERLLNSNLSQNPNWEDGIK